MAIPDGIGDDRVCLRVRDPALAGAAGGVPASRGRARAGAGVQAGDAVPTSARQATTHARDTTTGARCATAGASPHTRCATAGASSGARRATAGASSGARRASRAPCAASPAWPPAGAARHSAPGPRRTADARPGLTARACHAAGAGRSPDARPAAAARARARFDVAASEGGRQHRCERRSPESSGHHQGTNAAAGGYSRPPAFTRESPMATLRQCRRTRAISRRPDDPNGSRRSPDGARHRCS